MAVTKQNEWQESEKSQLKNVIDTINKQHDISLHVGKNDETILITSYQQFNINWSTIYNFLKEIITKIVFYNKEIDSTSGLNLIRNQSLCLNNFTKLQKITFQEPIFQNVDYTNCNMLQQIKLLDVQNPKLINKIISKSSINTVIFKNSILQEVCFYNKTIITLILLDVQVDKHLIQFFTYQIGKLTFLKDLQLKVKIIDDQQVNSLYQVLYKIPHMINVLQIQMQSNKQSLNIQQIISIMSERRMSKLTNMLLSFKFPAQQQVQHITEHTFYLMQQIIQQNKNLKQYNLKLNDQDVFIPINFQYISFYIQQLEQLSYHQFIQSVTFNSQTQEGNHNHYANIRRQITTLIENYRFYEYMVKNRGISHLMKQLLSYMHNKQSLMQDKIFNQIIYQLQFKVYYQRRVQQAQNLTDKFVIMYTLYSYEENMRYYNIKTRQLNAQNTQSTVVVPSFPFDQYFLQQIVLNIIQKSYQLTLYRQNIKRTQTFNKLIRFYSQKDCLQNVV